jgi:3-oxosteroid 1-dehydrogenase
VAEQQWDETVDFLIVGSGGGSMCAGLALKALGKTPLILEKTDKFGGSTAMSGGVLWVPNHPLQKREGVVDSEEAGRIYLDAVVGDQAGPGSTRARKEAFLKTGPKMIEFLEGQGVKFVRAEGWSDYYDDRPGGSQRGRSLGMALLDAEEMGDSFSKLRMGPMPFPAAVHELRDITLATRTPKGMLTGIKVLMRLQKAKKGKPILGVGGSVQGRMLMAAAKHQVPMRTDTAVVDLIEENGRIVGVEAVHDGKPVRIRARDGVLINAGGFSHNAEMRRKYGPQPSSVEWTNANPGDTGEMIEAAERRGAALDLTDQAWWVPGSLPPHDEVYMHVTDLAKPHVIMVNGKGERFTDEAGSYMENGQRMYAQKDWPLWFIMESRHRQRYPWGTMPAGKTPAEWVESGYMKTAGSIEELARQIKVDPQTLKRTVDRYNGFCRTGVDEDFHRGARAYDRWHGDPRNKPNPSLGLIEKAPFYAFKAVPGDVGTAGGIVTDEYGRVLRPDGRPIPGLYATGNSTASVMGRHYPGAGASIAASFVFAYIAAHHAVGAAIDQAAAAA